MNDIAESSQGKIKFMEYAMMDMPQAECPVRHVFMPGLYVRELTMKAGTFAIGLYQRFPQVNVFERGKVRIVNADGTTTDLCAPMTFIGQPGQKCGLVLEDTVWLNIYATDETDIETLEATYFDKSLSPSPTKMIEDKTADIEGFKQVLFDTGYTDDIVRTQSEDETDQIPFPYGAYKIGVFPSPIEGKGIFATADISKNEIIAPSRIGGKRTPAGRYTNHSETPNAKMVHSDGNIYLMATRDIKGCLGGCIGEEVTTDYRDNVNLIRSLPCQE